MAIVGINYKECGGKNLQYKSVRFNGDNDKDVLFESGDFVRDWYDCVKHIITGDFSRISHSSSVDHFFMDGAKYDSAFLHIIDGNPVLKYVDYSDKYWFVSDVVEGMELFVPADTRPTWEELKDRCKHTYKIVEKHPDGYKYLFHNRKKPFKDGDVLTAEKKMVYEAYDKHGDKILYMSGIHVITSEELCRKYLKRFKNKDNKTIVKCLAEDTVKKPRGKPGVLLADKVTIIQEIKI